MFDNLVPYIQEQLAANQFLSGGAFLMALGYLGWLARRIPEQLWNLFLRQGTIIVDVMSSDQAYDWLLHWLDQQDYGHTARRISVRHIRLPGGELKTVFVPARGHHWFFYKGRLVWLVRNKEDSTPTGPGAGGGAPSDISDLLAPKEQVSIRILGRSRQLVNALIAEAEHLYRNTDKDKQVLRVYRWGAWAKTLRAKRPLASVMLPPSADGLLEEMRTFTTMKDWYTEMGIPYRRGYLFYGPPGTGKSCSVEALAGVLNLPIYNLSLANRSDDGIQSAFEALDLAAPGILLLEDIDTVLMARDGKADEQKASLGTLLNCLDGVTASENVILVMTTNHPEKLDPALVRAGRVDRRVEFGMATEQQIEAAVARFLPNPTQAQLAAVRAWPHPISMATVQENLKQLVLRTPQAQVAELVRAA